MPRKLDWSKPYSTIYGLADHAYEQERYCFDHSGNEIESRHATTPRDPNAPVAVANDGTITVTHDELQNLIAKHVAQALHASATVPPPAFNGPMMTRPVPTPIQPFVQTPTPVSVRLEDIPVEEMSLNQLRQYMRQLTGKVPTNVNKEAMRDLVMAAVNGDLPSPASPV